MHVETRFQSSSSKQHKNTSLSSTQSNAVDRCCQARHGFAGDRVSRNTQRRVYNQISLYDYFAPLGFEFLFLNGCSPPRDAVNYIVV